jgi:hypothetical protein
MEMAEDGRCVVDCDDAGISIFGGELLSDGVVSVPSEFSETPFWGCVSSVPTMSDVMTKSGV